MGGQELAGTDRLKDATVVDWATLVAASNLCECLYPNSTRQLVWTLSRSRRSWLTSSSVPS